MTDCLFIGLAKNVHSGFSVTSYGKAGTFCQPDILLLSDEGFGTVIESSGSVTFALRAKEFAELDTPWSAVLMHSHKLQAGREGIGDEGCQKTSVCLVQLTDLHCSVPIHECMCIDAHICLYEYIYVYSESVEKGMVTHSSLLACRIPWTEEPGGLQSMGSQSVRHE